MNRFPILFLLFFATPLAASPRTSAHYELTTEAVVSGAPRLASANYTLDSATHGGAPSLSPNYALKPGYAGQLYDLSSLAVAATPGSVDETSTAQLNATATADDDTTLAIPATAIGWSVLAGPILGINATGLATADAVYENETATAQAAFAGLSGSGNFTVLDTDPDNFEDYGGDGLDDAWQVGNFGLPPNADAGPGGNPDGDTQDNRLEWLAGYDPNDSTSFFDLQILSRTGTTATLELSKIIPGRRYYLERSTDLGEIEPWTDLTSFTTPTEELDEQVTDLTAGNDRNFYRIRIEPE